MPAAKLSAIDGGPKPELAYGCSLWSLLEYGASKDSENTALISMSQPRNHLAALVEDRVMDGSKVQPEKGNKEADFTDCLRWSYAQLSRASASVSTSAVFQDHVTPGDTIVTILPGCVEWAMLQWVAALRCLTFVPLDTSLLQPDRQSQLIGYLQRLKPALVVVETEDAVRAVASAAFASTFKAFRGLCLSDMDKSMDNPKYENWLSMSQLLTDIGSGIPNPEPDRLDRIALILFTSGTSTGRPKGCPATVKNLLASTANNSSSKFDSRTVAIVQSANFRIISWGMSHNVWKSGGTVVIPDKHFNPTATLRAIETTRATHIGLVPIQMFLIAKSPQFSTEAVSSMRGVWVGGDIGTKGVILKTQETFPTAVVCGSHGMTEGLGAFGWPTGVPIPLPSYSGIFSCGKTMPGFKIRILGENGELCSRRQPGELHISGDAMIERYLDDENPTSFYKKGEESWLITGDIAVLDEDDFVYVLSRSKDVIKKGGTPLTPASIEATILQYFNIQVSSRAFAS